MSLFTDAGALHIPAVRRAKSSTSQAPATPVIATLAALLGARADVSSAVSASPISAAGIVVGKLGTAVVHPDELA